jgi:acyl-CoA synthetase (AMP-forming)/AMP-acid ligase II
MINLSDWIEHGGVLKSSGTTGEPKVIFQSPEKLKAANSVAIESQELTSRSRVYTVCKTQHAGGLLAQTLPAYSIDADIVIEDFNAYRFMKEIHKYTHTHITPNHAKAIMGTKAFEDADFSGIWFTCGSDPVTWDILEAFTKRGAVFMTNWGMTEIGPCAINTVFKTHEQVKNQKLWAYHTGTILGDRVYCDYKIVDNELWVKGDICVYDDWFNTKDLVHVHWSKLYYLGRNEAR